MASPLLFEDKPATLVAGFAIGSSRGSTFVAKRPSPAPESSPPLAYAYSGYLILKHASSTRRGANWPVVSLSLLLTGGTPPYIIEYCGAKPCSIDPPYYPPSYSPARPLRMQELQPSARRNRVEVRSEGRRILDYWAMAWMGHDAIMDGLTYGGEA